jgi:hypothetical protein
VYSGSYSTGAKDPASLLHETYRVLNMQNIKKQNETCRSRFSPAALSNEVPLLDDDVFQPRLKRALDGCSHHEGINI